MSILMVMKKLSRMIRKFAWEPLHAIALSAGKPTTLTSL